MKRLILTAVILCLLGGVALANRAGFELIKDVNGGYQMSAPIIIDTKATLPFSPKVYLKANPIFNAPRGALDLGAFNHTKLDTVIGMGFVLLGCNIEFETGAAYWWAGNNFNVPEGWYFNNAIRGYYDW